MCDPVARLLNMLLQLTDDSDIWMYGPLTENSQYCKGIIVVCFNDLMNHLRRMMTGYENEQVHGLFKDMEMEVDRAYTHQSVLVARIIDTCEKLCHIRYAPIVKGKEIVVDFDKVETLLYQEHTTVDELHSFLEKLIRAIDYSGDIDYTDKRMYRPLSVRALEKKDIDYTHKRMYRPLSVRALEKKNIDYIHKRMYRSLSVKALEKKRSVVESFEALMNHLRKMMLGYENEEVHVLFEKMERKVKLHFCRPSLRDMMLETYGKLYDIRYGSSVEGEREVIVGFDEEVEILLDQLTSTSTKQLQVISIAGMAGLGKTTLAGILYKNSLIKYVFDIRAWICVSQEYQKRDLLFGILSSFINDLTDEIYNMSDEQLGEKLYRCLKDHKYLVVLDDIWDCKAWNDLKFYFPDDKIGSRVIFTSRDKDVSLHVGGAKPAHVLRLRNADESWDIFQKKVFKIGILPDHLKSTGRRISNKCGGLPLAIVITAGLLKNKWSHSWWMEIFRSLHSFMVCDSSKYIDSLDLSYNHLPPNLKPCFVFVGVQFPEDYEILVTKLIWLWIAQGFINEAKSRTNLEDVAQDILMELINRSLLMTAKKRADGQIKTCRIHDLLRDLCLRKAREDNFSPHFYKDAPVLASSMASSSTNSNMEHGMSVNLPESPTQSGFSYQFKLGKVLQAGGSICSETYASLRILDVESVPIALFPSNVTLLANLRYLAIQAGDGSPKASISKLLNLQMLIISSKRNIVLPNTIWNMVNLRHLYMKSGENLIEKPTSVQVTVKDDCPSGLDSLQTLSQVSPQSCQNICSRTPNLRKLGFCGPLISNQGAIEFPNIRSLEHLQKLKLLNTIPYPKPTRLLNTMMFPEKLKLLSLSNTAMDWEDMWTLSLLPNLEVLKLKFHACIGKEWDTSDANFQRLKILKLHGLNIGKWVCSRDNFPCLQRLVIRHCSNLTSIPSDLGRIWMLEAIEIQGCKKSVQVSALKIQEEKESEGDCFLKVHAINNL